MKVLVGDIEFDSVLTPIRLELNDEEKQQLKDMAPQLTRYASFPQHVVAYTSVADRLNWMLSSFKYPEHRFNLDLPKSAIPFFSHDQETLRSLLLANGLKGITTGVITDSVEGIFEIETWIQQDFDRLGLLSLYRMSLYKIKRVGTKNQFKWREVDQIIIYASALYVGHDRLSLLSHVNEPLRNMMSQMVSEEEKGFKIPKITYFADLPIAGEANGTSDNCNG